MKIHDVLNQLIALSKDKRYWEPQICSMLGDYLRAGIFAQGGAYQLLEGLKASLYGNRPEFSSLFLDGNQESGMNPNAKLILSILQREVFLPSGFNVCRSDDPTKFRCFYPFVLAGCFKVDAGFGPHSYNLTPQSLIGIRKKVRTLFGPYSFSRPVLFNKLYPVSAFRESSSGFRKIHSAVNYLADSLYYGSIQPRPGPRFDDLYSDEKEEFLPKIQRDYRMIFGIACLEIDHSEDPSEFVRKITSLNIREDVIGSVKGNVQAWDEVEKTERKIELSRLTINRPLPALDGWNHFAQDILLDDIPTADFWDNYKSSQ